MTSLVGPRIFTRFESALLLFAGNTAVEC